MKMLITGATGFVGGRLAERLIKEGHEVKALVRESSNFKNLKNLGVELIIGDITDTKAVESAVTGVDYIFHIAALFRQAKYPDSIYWDVNVGGTRNIMEAALKHGTKRVVHCSTIGVLSHIENPPADETFPYNPGDIYQTTKAEGEKQALIHHSSKGLPVVVIRPAMIYGPGDLRLLKLFKTIAKKKFIMIGNGKTLAHFIYIDDLVDSFLLAAEKDNILGEIFIIAGEKPITLNYLTQQIAKECGTKIPSFHIPAKPIQVLGSICELICKPFGIEPPLYRRRVDFFTKNRSFDTTKAKTRLGFIPKISVEEGIKRTLSWYQTNNLI